MPNEPKPRKPRARTTGAERVKSPDPSVRAGAGPGNTMFTEELLEEILSRVVGGESLKKISRLKKYPNFETLMDWRRKMPAVNDRFILAMELRANAFEEEALHLVETTKDYKQAQLMHNKVTALLKLAAFAAPRYRPEKTEGEKSPTPICDTVDVS